MARYQARKPHLRSVFAGTPQLHFADTAKQNFYECVTNYRQVFWLASYLGTPSHPAPNFLANEQWSNSGTFLLRP